MARTFISFSNKDEEVAHRVYDALILRGIDCWISTRNIPTGANYQEEIVRAIKTASVMVLIFSENANSSLEIPKEIALASQNHLVLMPLKIDETEAVNGFEYNLATSQWIALYQDFDKNIEDVGTTIKMIMERSDLFASLVQEAVDSGEDIYKLHVKDYLIEEAKEMLLTTGQAEKIINIVLGRKNSKESEQEYLKLIKQVLEDKVVSQLETKMLSKKANQLGISALRADELLAQEKYKLGILGADTIQNPVKIKKSINKDVKINVFSSNIDTSSSSTSTIWHLNTGARSWVDQKRYHYWTAGGGKRYKETIHKIKIGDEVYAYMSRRGYVAHGFVIGKPTILNEYICMSGAHKDKKLIDLPVEHTTREAFDRNNNERDADYYEYTLPVEWITAFDENEAKFKDGLNISPLTGCRLSSPQTLDFLKSVFGLLI